MPESIEIVTILLGVGAGLKGDGLADGNGVDCTGEVGDDLLRCGIIFGEKSVFVVRKEIIIHGFQGQLMF